MVWSEWSLKSKVITFFLGCIASYRGDGLFGRHGGHLDGSLLTQQGFEPIKCLLLVPVDSDEKRFTQENKIGHLLSLSSSWDDFFLSGGLSEF